MPLEIRALNGFYESPRGQVARLLIAHRLRACWTNLSSRRLLGFGYATPFLRPYLSEAERVVAVMPAAQGVVPWPPDGKCLSTLVEDQDLPFPDASFDCVLVVHGLEVAEAQRPFMRELWRVLTPDGRLLIVTPNRTSLWAQVENSPFGHGQPYTRSQLKRLLEDSLFQVEAWDCALFMPPFGRRSLRTGAAWDRIGRRFWPQFAGVHIVEATKSMYAMPLPKFSRVRRFVPALGNT